MVKLATIRRINETKKKLAAERKFGGSCANCKKQIEEFEGKLAEEKKLLVEFTAAYDAKGNSLKYLAKWMKCALRGLREEIGKIAHVDKGIDKAMKWMDWLIWEEVIPHGGRTMAAGQELGKFELEMPKDEEEE